MYIKNTAGQHIGFLLTKPGGAPVTFATVTVKRSIDGGSQTDATGTVTELGNGQYNLAMSQADTNGDEISFLFVATSAVPVEKTITTGAPSSQSSSLPLNGAPAPSHKTGRYYPSTIGLGDNVTPLTLTATRIYYVPYFISEIRVYAGFVANNTTSSDSGKKIRMGLYTDSNGNPGALVQAATEVTLSGSSADLTTSNAFTPTYIGWHWICLQSDTAPTMMRTIANGFLVSSTGIYNAVVNGPAYWGVFTAAGAHIGSLPVAYYVDTTYGALASTAVAPTTVASAAPWLGLIA